MDGMTRMMAAIDVDFARTARTTGIARITSEVESVMRRVPRDRFLPPENRDLAWEDRAVSIGYGVTISQPFIVALMTTLLGLRSSDRVLEIGTGSGYQAAILSGLAGEVHSLEFIPELAERAATTLRELGCDNVHVHQRDGWLGLAEHAPYDAILVTACASRLPEALVDELAPGGRMILPLQAETGQELVLVVREPAGTIRTRTVLPVVFVPMVGRGR